MIKKISMLAVIMMVMAGAASAASFEDGVFNTAKKADVTQVTVAPAPVPQEDPLKTTILVDGNTVADQYTGALQTSQAKVNVIVAKSNLSVSAGTQVDLAVVGSQTVGNRITSASVAFTF